MFKLSSFNTYKWMIKTNTEGLISFFPNLLPNQKQVSIPQLTADLLYISSPLISSHGYFSTPAALCNLATFESNKKQIRQKLPHIFCRDLHSFWSIIAQIGVKVKFKNPFSQANPVLILLCVGDIQYAYSLLDISVFF